MSETSKKNFIDDLAPRLYVALIASVNTRMYGMIEPDAPEARRRAKNAYFLAEQFWSYKEERENTPSTRAFSVPATTLSEEPKPFDKDAAFEAEFKSHMSGSRHQTVVRLYVAAVKDAALAHQAERRVDRDVPTWPRTLWIVQTFADLLTECANAPGLSAGPLHRVTTDILHAKETMFPETYFTRHGGTTDARR